MAETPKPPLKPGEVRRRLPLEEVRSPFAGATKRGGALLLGAAMVALGGLAVYMSVVVRHPWTSPYVIGPAVGAVWFALRLFMNFSPKA